MKEPYLGFTFDGQHSSDFGLLVVSDGSRYHQSLSSEFSDYTNTVAGYQGSYYFGTQIGNRSWEILCAFDSMTAQMRNKLQNWLYPNKVGWLVFDETPYKKYLVKLASPISLSYIPFDFHSKRGDIAYQREILKGEAQISFMSVFEFGEYNEEYERENSNNYINEWMIDSGILPEYYSHTNILLPNETMDKVLPYTPFNIYNAGNGTAKVDFQFNAEKDAIKVNSPLEITNVDSGESYIVYEFSKILQDKYAPNPIPSFDYYKFTISGTKQEIWVELVSKQGENDTVDRKVNISCAHNHFFPKIYHIQPMEIVVIGQNKLQTITETINEPILYPLLYQEEKDMYASDEQIQQVFQGFSERLSDYFFCTERKSYEVNNIINPSQLFFDLMGDNSKGIPNGTIAYFIRPNRFISNKELYEFQPIYNHSYI